MTDPSKNRLYPPFPVSDYLANHPETIDAKRFRLIPSLAKPQVLDHRSVARLSATGAWAKLWAHWGGLGVLTTDVTRGDLDMPYIRMAEEAVYGVKLGELLDSLDANPREELAHRDFCAYYYPYDQLWFVENHEFWWLELDFERLARVGNNAHFVGWHNVEVFGVPTAARSEVYVPVPSWWKRELEPSSLLNVPSPCALVYFSTLSLSGTREQAANVWRAARSEHAVAVLMYFLAACRDGVSTKRVTDYRLHHSGFGVLCPIHPDLRQLIDDYGFFHIVRGSDFEAIMSYVAYFRSSEVDWSHQSLAIPFYHYD